MAQVERLLATPLEDSPALMPLRDDPTGRERIVEVVRDVVNPAYEEYLGRLRDYLPHATETIGLSALPDGDADLRRRDPQLDQPPPGCAGGARPGQRSASTRSSRSASRSPRAWASPLPPTRSRRIAPAARTRPRPPRRSCDLAEDQVQRSWDAAPAWFGRLPSGPCEVRAVEAFREADMPAAFYNPPTEDGSRAGVYYINTYDLPSRDIHSLAGVSYHEAHPGHHFQFTLEQEDVEPPATPPFRRHPRRQRVLRRVGAVQRAAGRGDGPVPRRLGASGDAGEPDPARGAPHHRHRHPRAGLDAARPPSRSWRRAARPTPTPSSRSTATSRCRGRRSAT